ncbi:MAG: acyl-ACP--UDP-N-acetylglucosamine O-acyltransferase [Candidatus Kapaibacterium sp.]|jgi:UDP-N-acetylglucosamine acyltransferase
MPGSIHPTAIIDPSAEIASGVEIGPYAIIEGGVTIDEGTIIHHHAFIGRGAQIGKRCVVHHAAVVSNVPQDLKFKGTEETYVIVGDDCTIREFATLHRATIHTSTSNAGTHDGTTRIGRGSLIMAYAHVAHDCVLGEEVILSNAAQVAGHVTIEKWAIIGGGALIHQFSLVGSLVMIGGGSHVRKDVPPYCLASGSDFRVSGVNKIGLQRRGATPEAIDAIKAAFSTLYYSGQNLSDAAAQLEAGATARIPEVRHLLDFIKSSHRGVAGRA